MSVHAPQIDSRNAADITKQLTDLVTLYVPAWKEIDPKTGKPKGMSAALIGVFARFCEIIIQRINEAPNKNFLAFLDMLGTSLQPPQPARTPLTFSLSAGSTDAVVVPAGTQAAAPPAEGEKNPTIFETERDLMVTPAALKAVFTRQPGQDTYSDYSKIITTPQQSGVPVFHGGKNIEHVLYMGDNLLGLANIMSLNIMFTLVSDLQDIETREILFEFWDGTSWVPKILGDNKDMTNQLTKSEKITFDNIMAVPISEINGINNHWIRCQLVTPITKSKDKVNGMVRESQLPSLKNIQMEATIERTALLPQNALFNLAMLDLTNAFFPFGEKPKFGDTLYLACDEDFALKGATITINVELVNPSSDNLTVTPIPVKASTDLKLQWEFWNGIMWKELSIDPSSTENEKLTDKGSIVFKIQDRIERRILNGIEGFWIRVRIIKGAYGEEAHYTPVDANDLKKGYEFHQAIFAPPIISKLTIDYKLTVTKSPEVVMHYNDFVYTKVVDSSSSFLPFKATQDLDSSLDLNPSFYLGFTLPAGKAFPNKTVSLYIATAEEIWIPNGELPTTMDGSSATRLNVTWKYWNGEENKWADLSVEDGSENFTRSGIVNFLPPSNFAMHNEFEINAFWIRAVWISGQYSVIPKITKMLLNTTVASQTVTIRNEIVGSSNQTEDQQFKIIHSPVLAGQCFEVREREMPPVQDQVIIRKEENPDAISIVPDTSGRPKEIWVQWHEVPDFYGSGPRDRHYLLDHLTGQITFGNGSHGIIPPLGNGNIRMTLYKIGGGTAGNRPANTINQLKTTLPYIEKVNNTEEATGGADAETIDSLIERAPRSIRHRNRSVTIEDFEDLSMLASPGVARAKCIPLYNLKADPFSDTKKPGVVSVIVLPRTKDAKPLPSIELINRVQENLTNLAIPTADVIVVGPLYLRVDVTVDIALASIEGASIVKQSVQKKLEEFLHPLTGGLDGTGWDFGREPYKSDLYALIEPIAGVDHITSLIINDASEDLDGKFKKTGRFLVYSGNHTINFT